MRRLLEGRVGSLGAGIHSPSAVQPEMKSIFGMRLNICNVNEKSLLDEIQVMRMMRCTNTLGCGRYRLTSNMVCMAILMNVCE